jgi:molybdopterin molybdotransferase
MLSIAEAQQRILERVAPLAGERVPLTGALGRVLAEEVVATRALPPFDNSAMDGYAVRVADLAAGPGVCLRLAGESRARHAALHRVGPGEAARIFTGAPLPPGADTVVMQEVVRRDGYDVIIDHPPKPGGNVRRAGEDIRLGVTALGRGTLLDAGAIGLASALGHTTLMVIARPRVAVLATGDELREPDEPLASGEIVSSNTYALSAQVAEAGGVPISLGIARDDEESIRERLLRGLRCNIVLSSGGVSVGDYDLVRAVLDRLGWESSFWKVNMKPGKPLSFGWLSGVPVIGLPGNPASSMVTFELFVRPVIRRMQGHPRPFRPEVILPMADGYEKTDDRTHIVRCRLQRTADGLLLEPLRKQESGMLTSMIGVDALAIVDGPAQTLQAGARVRALAIAPEFGARSASDPDPRGSGF